jgi:hypothetical protein
MFIMNVMNLLIRGIKKFINKFFNVNFERNIFNNLKKTTKGTSYKINQLIVLTLIYIKVINFKFNYL